jgi:nitronate monooxygenase
MDPKNLPESDPSKMDFGAAVTGAKAWKEIWGCGQGIGAINEIVPAAKLVDRLAGEYAAAKKELLAA